MNTAAFLSSLKEEIARLQRIQALLEHESETPTIAVQGKRRGRPPGTTKQTAAKQASGMSEAGRARIAAAQRRRWAAKKKADAAAAPKPRPKKSTAPAKQVTRKPSAPQAQKRASRTVALPSPSAKKLLPNVGKSAAKKPAMPAKSFVGNKAAPNAVETNPGE